MITKKLKVHIVGSGCDRRLLDSGQLSQYFKLNHCLLTSSAGSADYIVISTCAMSDVQELTSLKLIKKFKKYNGKLIIHGCLPHIAPESLKKLNTNLQIGSKDLHSIDQYFPEFKVKYVDVPRVSGLHPDRPLIDKFVNKFNLSADFFYTCYTAAKFKLKNIHTTLHPRIRKGTYLKISSGCPEQCSYCAIKKAVGNLKSIPIKTCLDNYQELLNKGHSNFILLGDNTGSYGMDIDSSFKEILEKMSEVDRAFKVTWTISELHPRFAILFEEEMLKYINAGKIIEICVPIQSGCDRVLNLMSRSYRSVDIRRTLQHFRLASNTLKLNTDIIVGFPTETDDEFVATTKLVTDVKFNQVQIFKYSQRTGTTAANTLENKTVADKEIIKRFKIAMKAFDKQHISYTYQ
ncbi:MAG: radical SAM protein [Bacteriovoracaceae bacterium]|nr:radical SAM protein [Bacteriovoracaceae bacterium]